jgi:phage terminase small subunit
MPNQDKVAPPSLVDEEAPGKLHERRMRLREELFVDAYITNGHNAAQAISAAGYKQNARAATVQGARLLARPRVQSLINERLKEASARARKTVDDLIAELELIAFARMGTFARVKNKKLEMVDTETLVSEGLDAAIQSYTETTTKEGGSVAIKLHDKLKAAELLGRYHGCWEKSEGGSDTGNIGSNANRVREAIKHLRKRK